MSYAVYVVIFQSGYSRVCTYTVTIGYVSNMEAFICSEQRADRSKSWEIVHLHCQGQGAREGARHTTQHGCIAKHGGLLS